MVVPLDSPRWATLEHAYGTANDVPNLIRAIEAERKPNYRKGSMWFEVYSSLYHQYSIYSATYAAMPHIVRICEAGTLEQRLAVLILAGEMRVRGHVDEAIPDDLLPDFESAMESVKRSSLKTAREAAQASATGRLASTWEVADLPLAIGGLRYPKSGVVAQLSYLVCEGWNVEASCPACLKTMVAQLRDPGITTMKLTSGGRTEPESAHLTKVDRTAYSGMLAKGQAVLARGHADWAAMDTPNVLAALALEFGEALLASSILDLGTSVTCAYCGSTFVLENELRSV